MEITQIDQKGIDFLINEEGIVLHPYLDKAKIPTIGIGMTYYPATGKKVTMQDKAITRDQAIDMFMQMLKTYEVAVYSITRDDLKQNEFNACVSLCYNIGTQGFKGSTAHALINQYIKGLPLQDAWYAWRKSGGKVDPVLVARRKREYALYIS